jgi:hypothetical protein
MTSQAICRNGSFAPEHGHLGAILAAAHDHAQGDDQDLVSAVAPGIAGAGILRIRKDRSKTI